MIPETILKKYSAVSLVLEKNDFLFHQGDIAQSFFIVRSGRIKMLNYSEEGREFVQGYFVAGESFGEPPFFTNSNYPASAQAVESSSVWKIPREKFIDLLRDHFTIHLDVTKTLCGRLQYKSTMLSELAMEEAEHRLITLMNYLIEHSAVPDSNRISFTRQQLADMTGLRVETVIRSIKALEHKGILEIDRDGKIDWKHKPQR